MTDLYELLLAQKLSGGGGGGGGGLKPILEGTIESLDFTATSRTAIIPRVDMPSDYQASFGDMFAFVVKRKGTPVNGLYIGGIHVISNCRPTISYNVGGGSCYSMPSSSSINYTNFAAPSNGYGITCDFMHTSKGDYLTIYGRYSSSTGTMQGDYEYKLYRLTNLLA